MSGYTYTLKTHALTQMDGRSFGEFLRQYAISITDLEVWYVMKDGSKSLNQPTADTVKLVAGALVVDAPIAAPVGAAMAAAGVVFAPWMLPAALAALIADIGAFHWLRKRTTHPLAVSGELKFTLVDVSKQRVGWVEYLLGVYAARHGWQYETQQMYSDKGDWEMGTRYGLHTGGGQPTPWGSHPGGWRDLPSTPAGDRQTATGKKRSRRRDWFW